MLTNQISLKDKSRCSLVDPNSEHFFSNVNADFEGLFKMHFKSLHAYAYTFVRDDMAAEEIVQNLFLKLWEKKADLDIHTSIKAFLYRSVYHDSLNYLKHQKVKLKYQQHQVYVMKGQSENSASKLLQAKELEEQIKLALSRLPEGCRSIFQMSRFEDLKYREIAEKLDISIKTVENQMGKALKMLRSELVDFLPLLFLLLNLHKL